MKRLFETMEAAFAHGEDAVLCTIIASSGSTPRGAGAKMVVFADGRTVGTVGGGAVEYHSIRAALEVHKTRASETKGFCLTKNDVADIGMICGGNVTVYFQFFDAKNEAQRALVADILAGLAENRDVWLVTALRDGAAWSTGVYDTENGLRHTDAITAEALLPLCRSRAVLTKEQPQFYVEPLTVAGRVYVFGGGHVSQELVPVISHLNFRTVVYENREEFARKELFPTAEDVILGQFSDIPNHFTVTRSDYIIIMTRGHQDDYEVLHQAMQTQAAYVGVIGSRAKVAATFKRLHEDGFTEADTARIHTPIGLPIGAETPAEIAISIAAQLIEFRAAKTAAD